MLISQAMKWAAVKALYWLMKARGLWSGALTHTETNQISSLNSLRGGYWQRNTACTSSWISLHEPFWVTPQHCSWCPPPGGVPNYRRRDVRGRSCSFAHTQQPPAGLRGPAPGRGPTAAGQHAHLTRLCGGCPHPEVQGAAGCTGCHCGPAGGVQESRSRAAASQHGAGRAQPGAAGRRSVRMEFRFRASARNAPPILECFE